MDKPIIVTGGAGFIGSHLVKKLLEQGREVVVIDDFSSGKMDNLIGLEINENDIEIRETDLSNYQQALESLEGSEVVFHLAAKVGGIKYLHDTDAAEMLALEENLAIDANVFRACHEQKVKEIIYASSTAVYPLEDQYSLGTIFSEKDFIFNGGSKDFKSRFKLSANPDGGYGWSKIMGEIQLSMAENIKIGIVRIFNTYGQNEPLDKRSHAISDLIRKAMDYPQKKFVIWGDGSQTRDYIYVSDCAQGIIKLEEIISGPGYKEPLIVNIGSGRATAIKEIADQAIRISGKQIEVEYDLSKSVGPISRTADMSKTKAVLGWEPKVSLAEGLEKTYRWIEKKIL